MRTIQKCLSLLLALLLFTAGCGPGDDSPSETSAVSNSSEVKSPVNSHDSSYQPTEQALETAEILNRSSRDSYEKLITTAYPQEELIENIQFFRSGNVNTQLIYINRQFPVECLRTFDDTLAYSIHKLQEGGLLYTFFYGDTLRFADYVFVVKELLTRENFEKIKIGDTIADVEAVDPGFKLVNSIAGLHISYKNTFHMVEDGFMSIHYKGDDLESLRVSSIEFVPNGAVLNRNDPWGQDVAYAYAVLPQDYPR